MIFTPASTRSSAIDCAAAVDLLYALYFYLT